PAVGAALAVTWGGMGALWLTLDALVGSTSVMGEWVERLQQLLLVRPASYLSYNVDLLTVLAFYTLPALLAAAALRGVWRSRALGAAAILALAILFAAVGRLPLPIPPTETWNLREIGGSRSLVHGTMTREPEWTRWVARLSGFLALTLLLAPALKSPGWLR